ncbi:Tetratricopeptide repeat protein 7A [Gossypium arboreum]|uniref:Tetratricopeptide repeat protein 7A n=1 Tax=Gossypium arboreum TaxID=29729 RepID=A0A0B0PTB7_GOSAR|nr:Tetratricopeptide repeat protein 7A [Gossypium arboreum]
MRSNIRIKKPRRGGVWRDLGQKMKCLCAGEKLIKVEQMIPPSESLAVEDHSLCGHSSKFSNGENKPDTGNIEEAELSLRESSSLNYEEARALLGRIEYQKGNIEAALHVFEGIDIAAIIPKMKLSLTRKVERRKRQSHDYAPPPMSVHTISLLLEAIFLKAQSLQHLQRFREAAQTCKVILDVIESSLPDGLPENFGADCKLQETLNKAVELLPELWKLSDSPFEAILSYRWALLHIWNLDVETTARIQKCFAVFLLYCGDEACPPNLRSQMGSSFVPRNNIEEAILLLMILLRKVALKRIEWDPSILDHLSFALSVCGDLRALAKQIEELLPGVINRKERYRILSLCYHGAGEDSAALILLRKLLNSNEDPRCVPGLMMASRICGEKPILAEEGISFAHRALESLEEECNELEGTSNFLLGVACSMHSKSVLSDFERVAIQSEALQALESAWKITNMKDPSILYHLSLENAEQRKLGAALYYAKSLLKLEGGSNIKGWLLLARILSAQKRFVDGEIVLDAALDQTGKWDQGELLRTKAKLQIARGQLKNAVETYSQLLALLQVQCKSFVLGKKLHKDHRYSLTGFEQEIWHDLAYLYISLSQWRDAEICLSKSKAISSYSAVRFHATGVLYERKGLLKEAMEAFRTALDIDPDHVPSMISAAAVLRRVGGQCNAVIKSLLMNALRVDQMNGLAWYNLGLLHKTEEVGSSMEEAAECFEIAAILEESAPIEPFR